MSWWVGFPQGAGDRMRAIGGDAFRIGSPRAVVRAVVSAVGFLAIAPAVSAQPASSADPFAGVEEMVVTGSTTSDLLAPTNTAAIGFDTADLASYKIEDLSDVADYVPNLEIRNPNATNAAFFIRGVGLQDFGANASSSVPIFQDGVPRNPSATQLVGLFDIGGISVLKGPQGSGLFRNSSAGAFVIQTQKPTNEWTGYAKASVGRITSVDARDANRYSYETALNVPVYEDIVSARLSARYSHENPFWENGCANRTPIELRPVQPAPNRPTTAICGETIRRGERSHVLPFLPRYIGEVDDYAFRGQIRIQPPDLPMDWTFRGEISNLNRDAVAGQTFGTRRGLLGSTDESNYRDRDITGQVELVKDRLRPDNPGLSDAALTELALPFVGKDLYKDPLDHRPYRGDLDSPGRLLLETHVGSANGLIDLEPFDVEINFGYLDYRKSQRQDTDLSPNIRFPTNSDDQAWEAYGDFTFRGESIGSIPLDWSTGMYGMAQKVEGNQLQFAGGFYRDTEFTEETYSTGVFAEGAYELFEAFTFSGGIRYNWERKEFDIRAITLNANAGEQASSNSVDWDAFTGFASIRYEFTEEFATYVRYSRGWKSGQFNPSRPDLADVAGRGYADPESIDAFEWGLEFAGFANRLSGTSTFFFYNYDNYQVFRLTQNPGGLFREVQNASQARVYGAELELNFRPLEGFVPEAFERLNVVLRGGWLEASYVEFTVAEERRVGNNPVGVSIDYSGNSLISSPNLQASGTITWPFETPVGTFTPQYDFTWTDDVPFDPNNGRGEINIFGESQFPPYLIGNRAYMLHNVRLTWAPTDSGIEVAGWCRNLTDQRYKTFAVDLSTFSSQQLIFVGDPRTCGADFRFTW
ncbi:MAG: TonB-dependent receptor [Myxococcota bacterium]